MSANELCSSDIKPLCEAYGCKEVATKKIQVSVGKFGMIELYVCLNCVAKFED